ncbi:CRISPR-associated protein Cas4 [Thermosulfurimonas dismutans]|uniref:CRISPR-associated exonuclease Cas4 n=1 Tax=Thermosulfurimonas dismutans TaxID=999894 RepID=A0A179D2X7_9BACT|nr:CRISPR-associated protein Cas4 [Thermosulfurimonas dismutans]OAQ20069.1 CRISPR-associated RecB family exonuclease Cas4a [Thermosulfurimonas dismutans]
MFSLRHLNGTIFYAYQVCPREAWFYFHRLNPDQEHPLLDLGRLVHETSYSRSRKEVLVDQLLKIDLFRGDLVAEVKRSGKHKEAARLQLAFYLYYLKHEKGLTMEGILLFPKERQTEHLVLNPELENRVEGLIREMESILVSENPPAAKKIRYCRSCSFEEVCWG